MKDLKVKLYIPYGYYHTGDYTETFKWEVDDVVADIIKKVMEEKQATVLDDDIIHEVISNGTKELQTLHDNLREMGYQYLVDDAKSLAHDPYMDWDENEEDEDDYSGLDMDVLFEEGNVIEYEFSFLSPDDNSRLYTPCIEDHDDWTLLDFLEHIDNQS